METDNIESLSPPDAIRLCDDSQSNWRAWQEFKKKWNAYTQALFFSVVGEDVVRVCDQLNVSSAEEQTDLAALMKKLDQHFRSQADEVYARYLFNNRNQLPNESVTEYVEALRELTDKRGQRLTSSALRDRLICGLRSDKMRDLLLDCGKHLSLAACLKACTELEEKHLHGESEEILPQELLEEDKLPAVPLTKSVQSAFRGRGKNRCISHHSARVDHSEMETCEMTEVQEIDDGEDDGNNDMGDMDLPVFFSREGNVVTSGQSNEERGGATSSPYYLLKQNICEICDLQLLTLDSLRKHLRLHVCGAISKNGIPYTPSKQRLQFLKFPELELTQQDLFDKALFKLGSCKKCGKQFANLGQHMVRCYPEVQGVRGSGKLQCKDCGKRFHTPWNLKSHQRLHTGEKPFKCRYCASTFYSSSGKYYHERRHTDNRPHVCQFCGKRFFTSSNLKGHQARHHGLGRKEKEDTSVFCDQCGNHFKGTMQLQRHLQRIHKNFEYAHQWPCQMCGKVYMNQMSMARHEHVCSMRDKVV